jgi:N-acetylmuramoyl-L-alanine amidase
MKKIFIIFLMSLALIATGCAKEKKPFEEESKTNSSAKIKPTENKENLDSKSIDSENIASEEKKTNDEENKILAGKIICIDAGHGINNSKEQERISPKSDKTKPKFVSGTSGKSQTEEELNLSVALKLEKRINDLGAEVYMTRQKHETDMSNIDRAEFGNRLNADITVKLHADGSEDTSTSGISMLVPAGENLYNQGIIKYNKLAGELILKDVVETTGEINRGVVEREDLTGFNWSEIPVVLLEMGFLSNQNDDNLLKEEEYQNKIVDGIADGLSKYFLEIKK